MPNHLQSRTDDMHKGEARRGLRLSTVLIIGTLIAVVAAILLLV
ncbi:hypothetical protein ACFFUB_05345 [Algimonas porphyrae]|uniref:Uncharacterized protein n=1 Tax=Algimonas porphyrae TaxID=1128113 RepID=A0ABQ5V4E0_9PROT|nr:hypothetical protein [Algimonas porphyrae]GLQ21834.1 hypothetical protein GCM10007854_27890 [Algimonas porphyrae]